MFILIVLTLPTEEYRISFHFLVSFSNSFINVLQLLDYRSFTSLVKLISRYFILFSVIVNGVIYFLFIRVISIICMHIIPGSCNFIEFIYYFQQCFVCLIGQSHQPPKQVRKLVFPMQDLRLEYSMCSSKHSHLGEDFCPCDLLFLLNSLLGSQIYLITSLSFLLTFPYSFLTVLVVQGSFCYTPISFQ